MSDNKLAIQHTHIQHIIYTQHLKTMTKYHNSLT